MKIINCKELLSIFSIVLYILFQLSKSEEEIICNKTHPILKNNTCQLTYCSEEDFEKSICVINNKTIKTQWLTNIIQLYELENRYIHPFLTINNDLIIQTTSPFIETENRNYYGLTNEGRYYFNNSKEEECPYFSIEAKALNGDQLPKYEGAAAAIQFENDENNYFLSVGNNDAYAEKLIIKEIL